MTNQFLDAYTQFEKARFKIRLTVRDRIRIWVPGRKNLSDDKKTA